MCCFFWTKANSLFITLQEAFQNNFESGSTAAVVLIVNGEILAANVGDSKILLCSEDSESDHHNRRGFCFLLDSSLLHTILLKTGSILCLWFSFENQF